MCSLHEQGESGVGLLIARLVAGCVRSGARGGAGRWRYASVCVRVTVYVRTGGKAYVTRIKLMIYTWLPIAFVFSESNWWRAFLYVLVQAGCFSPLLWRRSTLKLWVFTLDPVLVAVPVEIQLSQSAKLLPIQIPVSSEWTQLMKNCRSWY